MLKEFRDFAVRGNVIDLAVAVIIGGTFGTIVTSLVNDLLMPVIGLFLGGINFSRLSFTYGSAIIRWGSFVQTVVNFLIIAFIVFLMVRTINRFKKKEPTTPTTKECPYCFTTISLKATRCPNCTSELK